MIFDLLFLRPVPKVEPPDAGRAGHLSVGQSFREAPGMDPGFGAVLDQDTDNVGLQQEGLRPHRSSAG